jgi:hypothetical protein
MVIDMYLENPEHEDHGEVEDNIHRAELMIGCELSVQETEAELVKSGVDEYQAFLCRVAAQILLKDPY